MCVCRSCLSDNLFQCIIRKSSFVIHECCEPTHTICLGIVIMFASDDGCYIMLVNIVR